MYLKIPIPMALAKRLQREFDPTRNWLIKAPIEEYWHTLPEYEMLGPMQERVVGFDLPVSRPWVCVEVETFHEIDDDLKVLLLLKYDMSDRKHFPGR